MTEAPSKTAVKARLPRGFSDRDAADIGAISRMCDVIRKTYELYGFEALETPFIEFTDALGKFLPDLDRPNAGVFSFQDDDDQWLSLRYDLTAPLARHVAENYERIAKPYRTYRAGFVFRNEKPGPGRFRQFMQFDADTIGSASPAADAEMCMMAADTLERLGVAANEHAIKINSRKVLDGVLEAAGLAGEERAAQRLIVLRAIDKLDRLGADGVRMLLGPGRRDESGDYTKGADLSSSAIERVLAFTSARGSDNAATLANLRHAVGDSKAGVEGVDDLAQIASLCAAAGYSDARIGVDPAVVRGLEYYTGAVFEAELGIEAKDEHGRPVRFGSIGGGGRYDGLVARFRGEPVPSTGFSIGVSRLAAALRMIDSPVTRGSGSKGPSTLVLVLDRQETARYQEFVARLRRAGVSAELYLGSAGMNAQLKYADRRGCRCAVIQGSNERDAAGGPTITIRDLQAGAELAAASKDRSDYLELRQRAQFSAPENELVERVVKLVGPARG